MKIYQTRSLDFSRSRHATVYLLVVANIVIFGPSACSISGSASIPHPTVLFRSGAMYSSAILSGTNIGASRSLTASFTQTPFISQQICFAWCYGAHISKGASGHFIS